MTKIPLSRRLDVIMPVPPKQVPPPLPPCARCGELEGAEYEVCRDVADNRGIEVYATHGRMVEEHCGDRECPRKPLCGPCWDNLYDGSPVDAWWPAEAAAEPIQAEKEN